jgi:hypothetical protein
MHNLDFHLRYSSCWCPAFLGSPSVRSPAHLETRKGQVLVYTRTTEIIPKIEKNKMVQEPRKVHRKPRVYLIGEVKRYKSSVYSISDKVSPG